MESADEPVELLRLWDDGEAELVRSLLETYSIPCRISSQIQHSIWPISVDGLGEIRILVPPDRLEEAKEILAEHRRQGMEMIPGGKDEGDAPGETAAGEDVPPTRKPEGEPE